MSETKTFEELFFSSNLSHNYSLSSIKILLLSDLNSNFMYLEKLKEWQMKNLLLFDYIFYLGNFLNTTTGKQEDEEVIAKSEAEITSMLAYLENINLSVLYIPGGSDTKHFFKSKPPTLTIRSKNIHKKHFKLIDDLYVLGIGGDVPSIETDGAGPKSFPLSYKNLNCQNIHKDGYPYQKYSSNKSNVLSSSDELFHKDVLETLGQLKTDISETNTTPNIKCILLTHCGPFSSQTTCQIDEKQGANIYTGSRTLQKVIYENKDIIMNIHGDNRCGQGCGYLGSTCIINPGDLEKGNFAILELQRNPENNYQWEMSKLEFLNLN